MTNPGVSVAVGSLREDAGKWSTAAESLRGAHQVASGLTLADKLGTIPHIVGGAGTMIAIYDRLQQKFASELSNGAVVMDDVSATLRHVADTFEREDREAAERMKREAAAAARRRRRARRRAAARCGRSKGN